MEKSPRRRTRKSLLIKPSQNNVNVEVIDHVIPYEIIKEDTDVITIKCSYCCKIFDSINTHKQHGCKKVADFIIKCISCQKPYIEHRMNNTEKQEEDKSCDEPINDDHLTYQCCVCMKCYSDLSYTVRHIKYHVTRNAAEPSIHCGQCDKGFITKQQLSKHETVHTDARPFQCDVCGKHFKTPDNVKRHMYVHNNVRPFTCPMCGKEFRAKHMLRKHEETHSDERLFECSQCDKKYKAKNTLRDHLRVHTGQRPYKCEQCDQAFYRPSHLTTHKLVHSKVKAFACKECEKKFGRREHLKVHERIHSGEKPFKCTLCDRSFNQQAGLQAHLVSHSEERPHSCLKCNKTFKYPSQIKHHSCKPEMRPSMVLHQGLIGDVRGSHGVYMDNLPETMTDCETTSLDSTPCLNPANTIILIQIQNTTDVPLNEDITGTQQLIGDMRGTQVANESILDGSTVLSQGQLTVERTIDDEGEEMIVEHWDDS